MALVDLDFVQFYRPPIKTSLPRERVPKASTASFAEVPTVGGEERISKAPAPSGGRSGRLWGDDPIEFIDMTYSPPREHFSPSREPAPDLRDTEADAEDLSNGLCNTCDFDHSLSENHDDLPTVEELLFNTGETNQSKRVGLGGEHEEELLEHTIKDCDKVTTPSSRHGGKWDKPTVLGNNHSEGGDFGSAEREAVGGGDSSSYTSNGSTADGRDDELDTPNTQLTSVASSDDGWSTLRKINMPSTSNAFPPCRNGGGLSSSSGKQVCEINNGRKYTKPSLSNREDMTGQYNIEEMDVNNKEAGEEIDEEYYDSDSDSHEKNTPLLRPTNKRPWLTAREKLPAKRTTKRRRFSSSFSSGEKSEETGVNSDISSSAPTKPHPMICPRPDPPNPNSLERDTSDRSPIDFAGGRSDPRPTSRLAVVYEQQSWKGEIIKERNAKQGRGRPRKQYLIQWK